MFRWMSMALTLAVAQSFGEVIKLVFNDDGTMIPYTVVVPKVEGREYPLVLCLHGAGGRGTDNGGKGSEAFDVLSSEPLHGIVRRCIQTVASI